MVLGAAGTALFVVGLFVVGLYHLRGKSKVTVCANNMRRIGQAVNLYHDEKEHAHFPPGTVVIPELEPDRRLSWMVSILPYMESEPAPGPAANAPPSFRKGEALYQRFNLNKGWDDQPAPEEGKAPAPWFVCPGARDIGPGLTNYVGIGGLGPLSPSFPKSDPRAGFFGWDRVISRDDVTRGTAETIMVTERANDLGPWARGGGGTVTGVDPAAQPYVPRQFGGLHPHGANTLFADGHVNFITDRANLLVWEAQSRIKRDE
jgi:prepilin-type processing-associated H-X9-DG protein